MIRFLFTIINRLLNNESMTEEIKACCEDLKVLNKKEFKNLLKWRDSIRKSINSESQESDNKKISNDKGKGDMKVDEDQDIQEEVIRLNFCNIRQISF